MREFINQPVQGTNSAIWSIIAAICYTRAITLGETMEVAKDNRGRGGRAWLRKCVTVESSDRRRTNPNDGRSIVHSSLQHGVLFSLDISAWLWNCVCRWSCSVIPHLHMNVFFSFFFFVYLPSSVFKLHAWTKWVCIPSSDMKGSDGRSDNNHNDDDDDMIWCRFRRLNGMEEPKVKRGERNIIFKARVWLVGSLV